MQLSPLVANGLHGDVGISATSATVACRMDRRMRVTAMDMPIVVALLCNAVVLSVLRLVVALRHKNAVMSFIPFCNMPCFAFPFAVF